VLVAFILFAALSLSPLGHIMTWPLEDRFAPADVDRGGPITGIIVLGGGEDTHVGLARNVTALNEAGERMAEAIVLARRYPEARVVFSGGGARLVYAGRKESIGAESLLTAMGLPRERLLLEDRSRDTYENALYTKELVQPSPKQRWLLVTSAYHMPRAIGCFRQVGFPVEPWPVDYRTRGPQDWQRFFDKPSEGLRRVDVIAREWAGLVVYRLTGRIPSLLPGPAD
jgi:uncharacterized SAM-binding protein YcdF (DUF218 family)